MEILASQGARPVTTTPAANFVTSFTSVVDTGGKYDTDGKFATSVSTTLVANNGNNIRLQIP
jgi:hypothetical protein